MSRSLDTIWKKLGMTKAIFLSLAPAPRPSWCHRPRSAPLPLTRTGLLTPESATEVISFYPPRSTQAVMSKLLDTIWKKPGMTKAIFLSLAQAPQPSGAPGKEKLHRPPSVPLPLTRAGLPTPESATEVISFYPRRP